MVGLFSWLTTEIEGTKNVTSTADLCTDTAETATEMDGIYVLAATLQETELSEFQELNKHAVFPTLAELEGPDNTKWRPMMVTEAEPDKANAT